MRGNRGFQGRKRKQRGRGKLDPPPPQILVGPLLVLFIYLSYPALNFKTSYIEQGILSVRNPKNV